VIDLATAATVAVGAVVRTVTADIMPVIIEMAEIGALDLVTMIGLEIITVEPVAAAAGRAALTVTGITAPLDAAVDAFRVRTKSELAKFGTTPQNALPNRVMIATLKYVLVVDVIIGGGA